jgi:hypothetical protein
LCPFENKVLSKILEPGEKHKQDGEKFRDGRLNNVYCSPNIIRVNKSKFTMWAGCRALRGGGGERHGHFSRKT